MLSSKDIKKISKKILRHQQGLRDIEVMHPVREWYVGLAVAFILMIVSTLWSAITYLDNRNVEVTEVDESSIKTVTYREEAVANALQLFETKAAVRDSILGSDIFIPPVTETEIASSTDETNIVATTSSSTVEESPE